MCNKEQCKYYQHPKICVNKSYCNSQSSNICNSIENYCIGLEQQCKSLQEQINNINEYYKELRINAAELADKVIQNENQNNINFWKHQAELGCETTDRLSKQLEEKEQECKELRQECKELEEFIFSLHKTNELINVAQKLDRHLDVLLNKERN